MPTTNNRSYQVPNTGDDPGTWGTVALNPNFAAIDTNLGGATSVALTNTNVTLDATQSANGTIILTGALTGNVSVTFPSVQGWWSVDNQTTGAFVITLTSGAGNVIGLPPGEQVDIQVNGTTGIKFRNLGRVGSYVDYATTAVPAWITACTAPPYLNCDGSTFSATTYPALRAVLGGTTLPDLRGRLRAALNQGTGRITTAGSSVDGNTLLSAGGGQNVGLSAGNLPSHTHGYSGSTGNQSHDHVHTLGIPLDYFSAAQGGFPAAGQSTTGTTSIESDDHHHDYSGTTDGGTGLNGTAFAIMNPVQIAGITVIRAA